MEKEICIVQLLPHGRKVHTTAGTRLLEALVDHCIFLRSDCGGRGTCGKCRVDVVMPNGGVAEKEACNWPVTENIAIRIPASSLLSAHIIEKAPIVLPASFVAQGKAPPGGALIGVGIDLGTTTIAIYLCDMAGSKVLSSVAVKNPQALYGDDVMSRIGAIGESGEKLDRLQGLVVKAIAWGVGDLLAHCSLKNEELTRMVAVGNPAMIQILLGVNPWSLGISPYQPAFYGSQQIAAAELGLPYPAATLFTLPQVSGFIGGDILAAALATELEEEEPGTLLIDLGTNGELLLKGRDSYFATSCATGPAFEGAAISCGMQAIPGAIDRVEIDDKALRSKYFLIDRNGETRKPSGLCGSGVISAVAAMLRVGIVGTNGMLTVPAAVLGKEGDNSGSRKYVIAEAAHTSNGKAIAVTQKDIRSVQLGKAALVTGIEFLLKAAGMTQPTKIIVAGAFGSYVEKNDMLALGMVPDIDPCRIHIAGNSAGAGAVMALCDTGYIDKARRLAARTEVLELAVNIDFQQAFVRQLSFPVWG